MSTPSYSLYIVLSNTDLGLRCKQQLVCYLIVLCRYFCIVLRYKKKLYSLPCPLSPSTSVSTPSLYTHFMSSTLKCLSIITRNNPNATYKIYINSPDTGGLHGKPEVEHPLAANHLGHNYHFISSHTIFGPRYRGPVPTWALQ